MKYWFVMQYNMNTCTIVYFTKKSINFKLCLIIRHLWVMKFGKKFFVKMLKFKDLWALEKKGRFRLLFNLETMKFRLWLDSNPGPHASKSDPLSTIPNFLIFKALFRNQILLFSKKLFKNLVIHDFTLYLTPFQSN